MKTIRLFLFNLIKYLNIFMMCTMFGTLLLQVVSRKFLNTPLSWPEEFSLITMIWITFFGAYQCTVEGSHLKMDFLLDKIPSRYKHLFQIVSKTIVLVFIGITSVWGFSFIQKVGGANMPVTGLPMWLPYYIIWSSFLLMFVELSVQVLSHVKAQLSPDISDKSNHLTEEG